MAEIWIVEFRGEVTVARPTANGARWQFIGDVRWHLPDETFRAIRKLDVGGLIDKPTARASHG